MITLYHGSNMRIASIDLNQCNPYLMMWFTVR